MSNLETEKGKEFMRELTALTLKYGVVITGCGCCNSPFCVQLDPRKSGEYVYGGGCGDPDLFWKETKA